ncbi:MAG: ABC transporter substrate-binding protein [Novosphingobium sp.]
MAKSWPVSPDGRTYTFRLRDDVTFSDGTPFDAAAVRANLARIRDPRTGAAMTTAYIAPYRSGRVIDRYTFEAQLSEPYAPFLNVLAQGWLGMVSPRALAGDKKALATRPVGTGPFVVARYRRQQGITLTRRPDYDWAPDFVGHEGPAYLDRVEVKFLPEALIRYLSLASGQVDLTVDAPPQNAADIRADPDLVLGNRVNLGNPMRAITFNVSQPPFDELPVRRAFALAIDRPAITRSAGFGEFAPTTAFLSATTPFLDLSATGAPAPDLAQANRLLDAAGWSARDGEGYRTRAGRRLQARVTLLESGALNPVIVAVQADVRRIGFKLDLQQVTAPQYADIRRRNAYQAMGPGIWHTNTPDGLYIVYHGNQITSDRFIGQNVSRLADRRLDRVLQDARSTRDPERLRALYGQAQARLAELVPAVPLFENHTLVAYRRGLRGVVYDTSHNLPLLTTAWLEGRPS